MNKKIIRKERIKDKEKDIIDSINIVAENFPSEFEDFVSSGITKDGIYKRMEFAIESIMDILNIINSDLDLGTPETEESVIINISQNKIFSKKFIDLVKEMKKFRNILVHKYGKIDDEKAFENIQEGIKDFEVIINEIEVFLKSQNSSKKEK